MVMVKITPCRNTISDRFPVASFVVEVPPHRWFEVACATDPRLFHVDHRGRRSQSNFATSRAGGLLRAPSGQATYILPPQQLRRFAGATRLYYAVGTYGGARGEDAAFTIAPDTIDTTPWIRLAPDFTGRALDRGRIGGMGGNGSPRYGGEPVSLVWGGDEALLARREAGRAGAGRAAAAARPAATARPMAYSDGFDEGLWTDDTEGGTDPRYLESKNEQVAASSRRERRLEAERGGSLRFLPVRGIENVSDTFKDVAYDIAQDLGVDVNHLMAVMSFETGGTFSPSVRNAAGSGAVGLIQFMPSTAKALGTTTEKLAAMSAEEQLDWVHKYLRPYSGKMSTVEDAYMSVLWPAAVGKGSGHVLFSEGSKAYEQNKGLDADGDGQVTVAEAAGKVRAILDAAAAKPTAAEGEAVYGAPWHWAAAHREEPDGYEDAPALRALALDDEPDGYEDGAALRAGDHDRDEYEDDESDGYEDAPDVMRRLGRGGTAGASAASAASAARYGRRLAVRALTDDEPAAVPQAPAPAAEASPPVELAGRYFDYSDEPPAVEELPDSMPPARAAALEGPPAPLDAAGRLAIIHYVAQFESGAAGYSAINADTEFENPKLPRYYHRRHVGLSWGLIQFAQGPGSLGFALQICARRDADEFARRFGSHHRELLEVTGRPTWEERLAPVVPPDGGEPRVLWDPMWTAAFAAAGQHRAFQEGQREAADRRYYEPFVAELTWLGLASPRAQAAFVDRAVHMGGETALAWIVKTVSPIRTKVQLADALRLVGAADVRSFQERLSLRVDGVFGPRTHAALIDALRQLGDQVPLELAPAPDSALIGRLVDAAGQKAAEGMAQTPPDATWSAIHRRLSRIAGDPALAAVPVAP